ncbi:pyridoxal-dependent decarboxylase [Streptomyces hirsutus]|uniref:pyridoxal phosphate-dependent decarboxylase family protein n=1 Tax=Streptomyces hirsutus TaxID=35620 RepID=UPI0006E3BA76
MSHQSHPHTPQADLSSLKEHLSIVAAYAAEVSKGLEARPPLGDAGRTRPPEWPDEPIGLDGALRLFAEAIDPGLHASAGPRYLGFVTGGTNPAALAGDWLTSVFDNNATSGTGLLAELERQVLTWLQRHLRLGDGFYGAFVTGATTSNYVNLATAREWAGERVGVSVSDAGVGTLADRIRILSASPHSSVLKSLSQLGLGRERMELVPTLPGREAIDPDALRTSMASAPDRPTIVVANAGTVNTVDFDDLRALADLRDEFGAWLHVDAAFGSFAALVPEHAHWTDGIDRADSVTVDLHKWFNVPYDSAVQFTKRPDLQLKVFRNNAAYLGGITDQPDFVHLTPENSRRARAIPAWFTIAAYGAQGLQQIVSNNIDNARRFGTGIERLEGARLLAPVQLNVACFTTDRDPALVLADLNDRGKVFMTPSVLHGVPCIRAAFSNWRTSDADVDLALRELAAALAPSTA